MNKREQKEIQSRLEQYKLDRAAAEPILVHWRKRFPATQYAWPGAPEDFAVEALRAIRAYSS